MRIVREDFLQTLEAVKYGLSKRETIEQSSKFVFTQGRVMAYNYEVFCSAPSQLDGIEGAVFAEELLEMLRDFKDEVLEVSLRKGCLYFKGKREKFRVGVDPEVVLQVDPTAKATGRWKPLVDDFTDGLAMAVKHVGTDANMFELICIHLHPKWIEACDNLQILRYRLDTGLEESVLIRGDAIRHIPNLGMSEFNLSPSWLFFRSQKKVIYGCRRYVVDYPDFGPFLKIGDCSELVLPKDLTDFIKRANKFSKVRIEDDDVRVELTADEICVVGEGPSGGYWGRKKVKYQGPDVGFHIPPKVFISLVDNHQECEVNSGRIRIRGDKWKYVAKLASPHRNGHAGAGDD